MADNDRDELVPEDELKDVMRRLVALPKKSVEKIKTAVPPPKRLAQKKRRRQK